MLIEGGLWVFGGSLSVCLSMTTTATDRCLIRMQSYCHPSSHTFPSSTMPEFKLYYFDIDGGAGEPIRQAFRLAKIPFEDIRVKFADWPALKSTGKCVFGQMPAIEIDGKLFAQSMAILRYVGKLAGLYPSDALEALRVDELLEAVLDIRGKMSVTYAMPDSEKVEARKKLADSFIKPHLKNIELRINNQEGGFKGFAVGSKLSVADLVLASDLAGYKSGRIDGIEASIANDLTSLDTIGTNVRQALPPKV